MTQKLRSLWDRHSFFVPTVTAFAVMSVPTGNREWEGGEGIPREGFGRRISPISRVDAPARQVVSPARRRSFLKRPGEIAHTRPCPSRASCREPPPPCGCSGDGGKVKNAGWAPDWVQQTPPLLHRIYVYCVRVSSYLCTRLPGTYVGVRVCVCVYT